MISVIIPTYKSPEALDLCLRSAIEGQENKNQIIVVVDGFYDLNKEVLEKWSEHIDVLNLEQNVGLCRGTNLVKDLGTDPKTFDLEKFWLFDYHYASGDKKEECGSTLPIFMSKIDYLRIGGWDENYELGMVADWDFFLKCQLSGLRMVRNWNLHFYHFSQVSTNGEKRQQAEINGHNYAKYKWGDYIKHDPKTNKKFI
jgi:GT2 family glycosyltransferase